MTNEYSYVMLSDRELKLCISEQEFYILLNICSNMFLSPHGRRTYLSTNPCIKATFVCLFFAGIVINKHKYRIK